ncbi:MAG: hypothetical protein NZ602_05475 [Thermoguttaceae bacterium]|nr:hypothetical protein [Thermoguttaceae bacterium]
MDGTTHRLGSGGIGLIWHCPSSNLERLDILLALWEVWDGEPTAIAQRAKAGQGWHPVQGNPASEEPISEGWYPLTHPEPAGGVVEWPGRSPSRTAKAPKPAKLTCRPTQQNHSRRQAVGF